jgi:hypothetical protein
MQSTATTSSRAWLSPLSGLSFLVIGVTGILMFFHVRFPGMTMLHEFGGILFVIVAALHLKVNWRPLMFYCKQKKGRIALCAGTVIMAFFLILGLGHEEAHRQHGGGPPSHAEARHH